MPEGSHRFQVGSVYCTVLADGYFSYPSPWFFPNADRVRLARALAERRLPLENVLCPYTCLLIETGRSVVLVDAGAGESSSTTGAIVARLEMEGIRPRHVDTVILTHAHADHIGGAVDARGRPVFPNARCILAERELEFWDESASRSERDARSRRGGTFHRRRRAALPGRIALASGTDRRRNRGMPRRHGRPRPGPYPGTPGGPGFLRRASAC